MRVVCGTVSDSECGLKKNDLVLGRKLYPCIERRHIVWGDGGAARENEFMIWSGSGRGILSARCDGSQAF